MKDLVTELIKHEKKNDDLKKETERQIVNLHDMYKNVKNNGGKNKYLNNILRGYDEHFDKDKNEKKEQYSALEVLAHHIEKIYDEDDLTETMLNECRSDKHLLVREMEKIRNNINRIID
jgi:hypothetical protein|tara:strand:- start:2104 stop:2460 length:357 start_codon:yes stop_codon:yes gene_type:complete